MSRTSLIRAVERLNKAAAGTGARYEFDRTDGGYQITRSERMVSPRLPSGLLTVWVGAFIDGYDTGFVDGTFRAAGAGLKFTPKKARG